MGIEDFSPLLSEPLCINKSSKIKDSAPKLSGGLSQHREGGRCCSQKKKEKTETKKKKEEEEEKEEYKEEEEAVKPDCKPSSADTKPAD